MKAWIMSIFRIITGQLIVTASFSRTLSFGFTRGGKKYKIVFVDPKGTAYADYQNKVDEFERIFTLDGQPRPYSHKDFEITFDLRLITDDINTVGGAKYRDYWLGRKDFSFLEL